ncbi:MAG: lysylphosphatidylglycerol synthase transmembrane domain-containing protein [bacterium]
MKLFKTQKVKFSLGIIISLISLYWAFKDVNFQQIIDSFKLINFQYLPIVLGLLLLSLFLRTLRWKLLLSPIRKESIKNIFSVLMIGYLGNNVLPARMGEVLRSLVLNKNYGYSKSASLATIILERLFDGITLLIYLGIALWFFPFPEWVKNGGRVLGAAFLFAMILLYVMLIKKKTVIKFISLIFVVDSLSIKISALFDRFNSGLKILKEKRKLLGISGLSLCIWFIEALFVFTIIKSFGLNLSFLAPLFVTIMVSLGTMIPSSPGYVGTYQLLCIAAFVPFGVEKDLALSISILMHGIILIVTTGLGLYSFWREHVNLMNFKQEVERSTMKHKVSKIPQEEIFEHRNN